MDYKLYIPQCHINKKGCQKTTDKKLSVHDWLSNTPQTTDATHYVEVQFKNTRKEYYINELQLNLEKGTMVAVESSPGHDIGEVTLTGKLVQKQIKKNNIDIENYCFKKIYRIAKDTDIEKYQEAKAREQEVMIKSREITEKLKLDMKIGDVEFQGDGTKAIFYYISTNRVDFRQLIRVLAETFRIRIEMKQIGARQEAGRIGGIGPCGRELCCSKWMTNFNSVSTNTARYQGLSMNPQKLAGQCAKLKCCINYEIDTYIEGQKEIPTKDIQLETTEGTYYQFKTDVLKGIITYSTSPQTPANLTEISTERAKEIIALNKKGEKPHQLNKTNKTNDRGNDEKNEYKNVVGQDSLTRFDNKLHTKRKKKKRKPNSQTQRREKKQ